MMNAAVVSLVLLCTSAAAAAVGCAHVVNNCNYPVTLANVPASGGGYEEEVKSLAAGETWEQAWTELSNDAGWSIKLSKTDELDHILQYEYTFHNDGIIWYDLSCVNGNPWDQDWEITANITGCNPNQQAYRDPTDDAYGMQSCPQEAGITVTLCTGVSVDNGEAFDASESAASYPSASESAPSYPSAAQVTPTTFATQASAVTADVVYGFTVTEIKTVYVSADATAHANRFRRHEDHAHAHEHEHRP